MSGEHVFYADCRVGRLIEARLFSLHSLVDAAHFQDQMRAAFRRAGSGALICADWRPANVMPPDVSERIAALDAFVFAGDTGANTRSSTLPIAFGAGVPVVATRGIETDPCFEDGTNVLFAAELSGSALGEALARLRDDPGLSARLSSGGLTLYDSYLRWDRIAMKVMNRQSA